MAAQPGRGPLADRGQAARVAAEADRRQVDHRVDAGRLDRGDLGDHGVEIDELVPGQRRRTQEQMLVRVDRAEPPGRDVAQHRCDAPLASFRDVIGGACVVHR